MKAMDANLDRYSRDGGFDSRANLPMTREIEDTLRTQLNDRQRMSVATNYFAMACPIMPLGLLGALMMLDKLGAAYDQPLVDQLEPGRRQEAMAQSLYILAMKQQMDLEQRKNGLVCSRPVEGFLLLGDHRASQKKPKDLQILLEGKRSQRLSGPVLLSKSTAEVGKLVKTKMVLQSHLEQASQEQDYGTVCRVSARIELLEKALKRMGC